MERSDLEAQVGGAPRRFMRSFWGALTDGDTYNVRTNPSLWLGFLLALPIPITLYMVQAPVLIKITSLFAPLLWSILLGAAGRVGIQAQEEKDRLHFLVEQVQDQARDVVTDLKATEELLGEESQRREAVGEGRQRQGGPSPLGMPSRDALEPGVGPAAEDALRRQGEEHDHGESQRELRRGRGRPGAVGR